MSPAPNPHRRLLPSSSKAPVAFERGTTAGLLKARSSRFTVPAGQVLVDSAFELVKGQGTGFVHPCCTNRKLSRSDRATLVNPATLVEPTCFNPRPDLAANDWVAAIARQLRLQHSEFPLLYSLPDGCQKWSAARPFPQKAGENPPTKGAFFIAGGVRSRLHTGICGHGARNME